MHDEYDKSLHLPPMLQTMEAEGRDLDEDRIDAALANLFGGNTSALSGQKTSASNRETAGVEG